MPSAPEEAVSANRLKSQGPAAGEHRARARLV